MENQKGPPIKRIHCSRTFAVPRGNNKIKSRSPVGFSIFISNIYTETIQRHVTNEMIRTKAGTFISLRKLAYAITRDFFSVVKIYFFSIEIMTFSIILLKTLIV